MHRIPDQCKVSFGKGERCPYFEGWCQKREDAQEENEDGGEEQTDLRTCLEFLRCCNTSLDILKDAGFESAMRYMAKHAMDLALVSIMEQQTVKRNSLILFCLSMFEIEHGKRLSFVSFAFLKELILMQSQINIHSTSVLVGTNHLIIKLCLPCLKFVCSLSEIYLQYLGIFFKHQQ